MSLQLWHTLAWRVLRYNYVLFYNYHTRKQILFCSYFLFFIVVTWKTVWPWREKSASSCLRDFSRPWLLMPVLCCLVSEDKLTKIAIKLAWKKTRKMADGVGKGQGRKSITDTTDSLKTRPDIAAFLPRSAGRWEAIVCWSKALSSTLLFSNNKIDNNMPPSIKKRLHHLQNVLTGRSTYNRCNNYNDQDNDDDNDNEEDDNDSAMNKIF